jgi:hypothetical protein
MLKHNPATRPVMPPHQNHQAAYNEAGRSNNSVPLEVRSVSGSALQLGPEHRRAKHVTLASHFGFGAEPAVSGIIRMKDIRSCLSLDLYLCVMPYTPPALLQRPKQPR